MISTEESDAIREALASKIADSLLSSSDYDPNILTAQAVDCFELADDNLKPLDGGIVEFIRAYVGIIFVDGEPYIYEKRKTENGVSEFGRWTKDKKGQKTKSIIRNLIALKYQTAKRIDDIYALLSNCPSLNHSLSMGAEETRLNRGSDGLHTVFFHNLKYDAYNNRFNPASQFDLAVNALPLYFDPVYGESVLNGNDVLSGSFIGDFLTVHVPDPEDREMLLQYIGLCLTTDTSPQVFLMIHGRAGSGKSMFLRLVRRILGDSNYSTVPLDKVTERFSLAPIIGKLANICGDISADAIKNEHVIKQITGDDAVTVERKYYDPITARSMAKMIFSCNSLPKAYEEKTEGLYRRLRIIEWCKSPTPPDMTDGEMNERLWSDRYKFICACLQALHRCHRLTNGKILESRNSKESVRLLRCESDSVQGFLYWIRDNHNGTFPSKGTSVSTSAFYSSYLDYCAEVDITPHKKHNFRESLLLSGFTPKHMNSGDYYIYPELK